MIPYSCQSIDEEDIAAAVEVLRSPWITQGPVLEQFERQVAAYCGARYAVAVTNGTAALHIACLAVGLQAGDSLWTSPNTFVASANCGRYCQADVDFVDIDPVTYTMSVEALAHKLAQAAKQNKLPKVIIPVHFAGQPCEMEAIAALARRYQIHLIEDAAHALGANYLDSRIGSCTFSDMTVLSFHPVKNITTGEGGMVLTNRRDLYDRLCRLRSHGIAKVPEDLQNQAAGPWYYEQLELGFNYRMTDIQAALGVSQLKKLDQFVSRRAVLAASYQAELQELPVVLPATRPEVQPAWHLYVIRLCLSQLSKDRRKIVEELQSAGIGVQIHYIPVHLQPYYRRLGFKPGDFPEAEKYYEETMSLPLHCRLTEDEQQYIIRQLAAVLR